MTETQAQFLAKLNEIKALAQVYRVDLTGVTFSDASRVVYYLANTPGSIALEPRLMAAIQATVPGKTPNQFDLGASAIGVLWQICNDTGQKLYEPPPPPPPEPVEADASPLKNQIGKYIGDEIPNQPGFFQILFPLPEGRFEEGGHTYLVESAQTAFGGRTYRAKKVA